MAQSQESSDEKAEELDSLTPPSPGEVVEVPEYNCFWVPLLLEHTKGLNRPCRVSPIRLLSACTGSFAEGTVLEDCSVRCGGTCFVYMDVGFVIVEF